MGDNEAIEILGAPAGGNLDDDEVIDPQALELREEVIHLNRVAKVVKGGRRFSFSALVVVGNEAGIVGIGFGKAREVPLAISKAVESAKRSLVRIWRKGSTIPYQVTGRFGSARVLLKPASEGTGIIAGTAVRTVCELGGINNVLTKSLGSDNIINVVKATFAGLVSLRNARHVAQLRGKTLEEMVGKRLAKELSKQDRRSAEPQPVAAAVSAPAPTAEKNKEAQAIPEAASISDAPSPPAAAPSEPGSSE